MTARTNNVMERQKVPLPAHWCTAMQCLGLDDLRDRSVGKVQVPDISDVRCDVLGQARQPHQSDGVAPGKTVALQVGGARVVYLLCAHVREGTWLCHRGSFTDGFLAANPFHEQDLESKDIDTEAWDSTLTKRLRSSSAMNALRALVQGSDYSWFELAAVARYRAEGLRAQLCGTPFDEKVAAEGFERDPWLWRPAATGWASQARITFLWSWTARDGSYKRVFEHARLHNILERSIPAPRGMSETDMDLLGHLIAIAKMEERVSKAPCKYLGLQMGPNHYEPDPQMWPSGLLEHQKSHVSVAFEWQHVGIRGGKHTATCRADNVCGGRRVPMNPLRNCPTGLTFGLAFFEAVGANVLDGIQFRGIAYETERSEILVQVPKEGLDVQREPVHGA